ncbi:hypothetical protein HYU15_02960 [Candidatus Woesearchaeota archaeon]|nr:hypothetical protein [Candidatus Woesearchaeota archaeon]
MAAFVNGYETYTILGRHGEAFSRLEALLQESVVTEGAAYRALVIGTGLYTHATFKILEALLPVEYRGAASALYSFEPFEVAAMLKRLGASYEVVVYDKMPSVLERVMKQEQMPLDDFCFPRSQAGLEYIMQLAGSARSDPDNRLLEAINLAAAAGNLVNRATMFAFLDTREFLEHMSFYCGDIRNELLGVPGNFDIVTMFNTGLREVPNHLANRINRGGFACIGDRDLDVEMRMAPAGFMKLYAHDEKPRDEFSNFYGEAILQRAA